MKRTYSHIDMDERRKIARWRTAGLGVELIAEKLAGIAQRYFARLDATPSPTPSLST